MTKANADMCVVEVTDVATGIGKVLSGAYPNGATTIHHEALKKFHIGDTLDITTAVVGKTIKIEDISLHGVQQQVVTSDWVKVSTEYFSPEEYLLFSTASNILDQGMDDMVVLRARGDSQNGKTMRFKAWAEHQGMTFYVVDCASKRDVSEWFGYEEARSGDTVFEQNHLAQVGAEGNAVILLDEVNRVNPMLLNSLHPMLDSRRQVEVHNQIITLGGRVLVGMTENYGLPYVATYELDEAFKRRILGTFIVTTPPPSIEQRILMEKMHITEYMAQDIVGMMASLRSSNEAKDFTNGALALTVGASLKLALLCRGGMTLRQAAEFVIINNAPVDLQRETSSIINAHLNTPKGFEL